MNWETYALLISQYGLPFALKLWEKAETKSAPTKADWDELASEARVYATDRMLEVLKKNGIDPNSTTGIEFMRLAKQ